ncbi:hypothetical protein L873DRAFT_1820752 [Choiromyces venosus 120613-1]|uniref:Uncharacterized protein n=1 Tax=Choiromyces venosus 120613-1 TaxID=1336337 RepID=A0A3N4IXP7_9PEZI|nr:hypothetical protein L873DRAFT_1820752 [Choiromyces venosus 120613-1]
MGFCLGHCVNQLLGYEYIVGSFDPFFASFNVTGLTLSFLLTFSLCGLTSSMGCRILVVAND